MTDRPIIFSAPMVCALLDGRKTQTRRVLKPQPGELDNIFRDGGGFWHVTDSRGAWMSELRLPYAPGDRLLAKERGNKGAVVAALTVTGVRVQRLQEISEADAAAEGAEMEIAHFGCNPITGGPYSGRFYRVGFQRLWNSLHGSDAWGANPWVAAVSFTVQRGNIDA